MYLKITQKFKALWVKLLNQNASPNAIAGGFAVGLFSTFYPIPVVDTMVALLVARLINLNPAACLIGNSFILLIFPVIPLLLAAEVFVGRIFVNAPTLSPPADIAMTTWLMQQSGPNLKAFILGGLLLGIPSALISFWGIKKATVKWQTKRNLFPQESL